ncbi:unnamed protein product, partial [Prorocentrum cordatum]
CTPAPPVASFLAARVQPRAPRRPPGAEARQGRMCAPGGAARAKHTARRQVRKLRRRRQKRQDHARNACESTFREAEREREKRERERVHSVQLDFKETRPLKCEIGLRLASNGPGQNNPFYGQEHGREGEDDKKHTKQEGVVGRLGSVRPLRVVGDAAAEAQPRGSTAPPRAQATPESWTWRAPRSWSSAGPGPPS